MNEKLKNIVKHIIIAGEQPHTKDVVNDVKGAVPVDVLVTEK